jgi:SAM-dependent methyltransferase
MPFVHPPALHHENGPNSQSLGNVDHYVGNMTFGGYCRAAEIGFPIILPLIDPDRITGPAFHNNVAQMNEMSWEFEDQTHGGRGLAYNLAQRNADNRKIGTLSLLKCFSESGTEILGPDKVILDALAGDGTITRFVRSERMQAPTIISADISSFMVDACLAQHLPCIRQSATQSLLRDSALDGVLIAYGSHHLNKASRQAAAAEAFRTVKGGGRFVLHDFEIGTPAADWFDRVVHPFSRTGHPHPHFSRSEMQSLLEGSGFKDVRVFSIDDPFVLKGDSAEEARTNALIHLYRMYDLVRIADNQADMLRQLEACTKTIFGEMQVDRTPSGYTATIPRQAVVAVGTKMVGTTRR